MTTEYLKKEEQAINALVEGKQDSEMTATILKALGYRRHHSASKKGYCLKSVIGLVDAYKGRFGQGYIVFLGKYKGSNTYIEIAYYVK